MAFLQSSSRQIFAAIARATIFPVMAALVSAIVLAPAAQAQTYSVLHTFTGGQDGAHSDAGVTVDAAGNLYGTTALGGAYGGGVVFKMTRHGSAWTPAPLYSFTGDTDGGSPEARVVFGPDGSLYGTTAYGGGNGAFGVVFNLKPPAQPCQRVSCPWTETVLHRFTGGSDGAYPGQGDLVFDQAGNVYGTTQGYGSVGTVFKLTPQGGGWTETILYTFTHSENPVGGVILDAAGNLYGTTSSGGIGFGTVYELSPSGSGWTEQTLYTFQNNGDGSTPIGGVVFDAEGNLYGGTASVGGTVYQLQPSNGSWIFHKLYAFPASSDGPDDSLTLDATGNLYGTVPSGGSGFGAAFKLSRSGDTWTETNLYNFGQGGQGVYPYGSVALDASGNLYSTTNAGGGGAGAGVVWEITP
ncbi:MAG: choice-of-anchor tandem repeat GloVer-containing protein [Candidatus Korobacteraceae bacterium]